MDHFVDIEVAIWAVRNHRLAQLEMELSAIEIESGPCCQSHALHHGFDDRACQTSTSIANADPSARFRVKMVTFGPALALPAPAEGDRIATFLQYCVMSAFGT
jgi:hypothetical protein